MRACSFNLNFSKYGSFHQYLEIMAQLDTLDILVLAILILGTAAYFTKGTYWGVVKDPYASVYANANGAKAGKTRNIVEKMEESNKNCVIFYGSQTGTAEDYASRLAKEGKSRYGLETMVADLEDYDFENLDSVPEDKVIMFGRVKFRRLEAELPAHPEVNPEPVVARKLEEHLLATRLGAQERLPNDPALDRPHIRSAKDSLLAMQLHGHDLFPETCIPAFPKIFHLRQFRHRRRLDRLRPPCYPWRAWKK